MIPKLFRDFLFLLAGFGVVWLLVTVFFFDKKDTDVISIDKEARIGEYFYESLTEDPQFQVIRSDYTDSCINIIRQRLTDSLGSDYDYQLHIFNNPMINAFALPGGHILISSGLIEISGSAEEIAAVVAHEMAHIELKHLLGKLIKDLGLKLILSNDALILSEVSHIAASTAFDRKKEDEADLFALSLLTRCKLDPRILGIFFRKMKDENVDYDKRFEMFMTHPNSDSRIRQALEYGLPDGFKPVPLTLDWDKFKEVLNNTKLKG